MRVIAVLAVVLLLSGCTWVRQELLPAPPAVPSTPAPSKPAPEPRPPKKPVPTHVERPPAQPVQSTSATPITPAPPDYSARCRAMADNRADDARQLGAKTADLTKLQQDVYRDCMAQSVKPTQ